MERRGININAGCFLKLSFCWLIILATTKQTLAATIDWKGATSTDWGTPSNWSSGTLPAVGDAVRIGVVTFTNAPILNSGTITTIASLTLGLTSNISLVINSGSTLAVTGAIIQNQNTINYGTFTTTFSGAGAINCASLNVGSSSSFPPVLSNNLLQLISQVASFHITGNVTINSTNFGIIFIGIGYNNVTFSLQGGTTTIDGTILTANTSSGIIPTTFATPRFSVDMPGGSALNPVLKLTNVSAINTSSVAGSIDFYNNTGGTGTSTVYYCGTAQEIYANSTAALDNTPKTYQYLQLAGAGVKTVDAGTLTVGNDLISSATSVLLNTNNSAATIGGNWINSSNVTQGSGNITITGSLTNNSGGTLGLGTGNLYIGTNYSNNTGGVYSQSSGTTYFNGSGAQSLTDNSTTGTTFKLVNFSGGGTSTMNAGTNNANFAVASTGTLTMSNNSKLVAGSSSVAYLMLKSDTNGTATVANIPSGCSITGFVAVQRFVQGSATFSASTHRWVARNYRLMSSPVNEGNDGTGKYPYSLNYLGASTIITDCTSGYSTTGGNPSLYLFNEHYTPSAVTFTSGNFIGVTNISNTLATGNINTTDVTYGSANTYVGGGYMMYFRGDKVTHISGSPSKTSAPYVAPESVTFSTTGLLNQGAYAVTSWTGTAGLMFSTAAGNASVRGFNLVGNPYPSSIDWSLFSNSNSAAPIYGPNVNPSIYILNPRTDNYDVYSAATGIATGNASNVIPSGQGFFVQANSPSPSLTFNEAAKTAAQVTGNNLLMGKPVTQTAYQSYMRLLLVSDSVNFNDIVIGFNSSATPIFNPAVDAQFFPGYNAVESLSASSADSVKASVKWLPLPKAGNQLVVPLNVAALESGIHSLNRTDLKQLPELYEVWLMDKLKNDSLDLRHNTSYAFNLDKTDSATFGSKRFQVLIRQDPARVIHLLNFTAAKAAAGSQLVWLTENEQNYTNFTVERSTDGGKSFQILGGVASADQGTYAFLDKNPAQTVDLYRLMIQDIDGNISYSKIIPVSYATLANNIALSGISVYPNPATTTLNLTVNHTPATGNAYASAPAYAITIVDNTGMVIKSTVATQNTWEYAVGNLLPGTYFINVINNADKSLVGKGKFVKQ